MAPVPAQRPPSTDRSLTHSGLRRTLVTFVLLLGAVVTGGTPAEAAAGNAGWAWPASPGPAVERSFEAPAKRWLPGHRGVDLHAPPGTPVRAPQAGVVSFSGKVVDREVLTIDHGDGHLSSFEPVSASVRTGDRVARGQVVATVAAPGHGPAGSAVHWGVREDGEYVNPLQFVADMRPSVLLPLPDTGP
ncbi:M23 family metallopeptidase [Kocuria sp.]|uniref:M23 family metallopeptidase n=1 Tax=Kocuria sp. TaxID=1871328 RepID=UPI0026DA8B91|nr:M23 family metallopeptidase [Kocuria sp.]MDO4919585.1 M23 family metallopeptidase [Kocuria sp.]